MREKEAGLDVKRLMSTASTLNRVPRFENIFFPRIYFNPEQ